MHARAAAPALALAVALFAARSARGAGPECAPTPPSHKLDTGVQTRGDLDVCMPAVPPAAAAAPGGPPASQGFWTTQREFAVGLGAVGFAAAAVGSALALQAKSKYDDALAHDCAGGDPNRCTSAGIEQGRSAHDLASFSTIAFVGAGALVGLAAVLIVLPVDTGAPAPAAVQVLPQVGVDRAGLALRARW